MGGSSLQVLNLGGAGDFFFLTVIFIMVSMHAVVVVAIRLRN